ncbi:MAG TPA: PLD nuclease N-terminal domain-containing protein [Dehalococcoidia bacterium]|jgi:hypothetical protein
MLGDVISGLFLLVFGLFALGFLALVLVAPLVLIVYTIMDIVHRDDLAAGKVLWIIAVVLLPLMGAALYWLSRPTAQEPEVLRQPVTTQPAQSALAKAA